MKKYLLILSLIGILIGQQGQNNDLALSPVVTYWKTLTIEEKETFLFSYLVQVYETHTELKKDIGKDIGRIKMRDLKIQKKIWSLITKRF